MITAWFRFYAELNDFLPRTKRQIQFSENFDYHTSVKHAIESLGVPHAEVDLILVNSISVDFNYLLEDGDRVSIYPVFEGMNIQPVVHLRAQPLREPRFVLDTHLGKLARYLRMLGFDTLYWNQRTDEELAAISSREHRILLTRDQGLLKRKIITHGSFVRSTNPQEQVIEVLRRYDLANLIAPFARCLRCNQLLLPVLKEEVLDRLQPDTAASQEEFLLCVYCDQLYWKGSHHKHMLAMITSIIEVLQHEDS
jgi:uncharacterized protein